MKKLQAINLLVLVFAIALLFSVGCFGEVSTDTDNEITAFEMTDWVFGETPASPSVTATHGSDTVKYYLAAEENGEYTAVTDFSSLKPGIYYLKAVIEKTDKYDKAEKITSFEVKNHTVHTAVGGWQKDETGHWKICACGEKFDLAAHVAGSEIKHGADKNYHWNECECGFEMNKTEHIAKDDNYLNDGTNHWKLCACGEKVGETAHVSDNVIHYNDGKTKEYNECTVCGAAINETDHKHTATGEYLKDGENHWKLCVCGEIVGKTAHVSDDTTHYDVENMKEYNSCTECGERMNETAHIHDYASEKTENGYECACGVAVNPFKGLAKSNLGFYDSAKIALTNETAFGGKKYAGTADSDTSIGGDWSQFVNSRDYYYDSYYFTLKFAQNVRFVECGDVHLLAGVQYLVKMTKRTEAETSNGGWHLSVKEVSAPDSEYKEITMGAYRLGDNNGDAYLGKAYFILFLHFVTVSGDANYDVEISDLYVKNTDFGSEFAGMTKVVDSALADDAFKAEETVGDLGVFYKENLTSSVSNSLGSGYTMDYTGQYTEYRFAFKATENLLIVVANGDYAIVPYAWYIMKVEKIPEQGEGAKKWKVYFKQVGADDSTFKEIAADDWKVGANTQVGDNTSASNLLCDMYIWRNDALQNIPFDFYATGIWAK